MKLRVETILTRIKPGSAIAKGIVVLLSCLLGAYITGRIHEGSKYMGAMLAAISGIVVLQDDFKTSIHQGWLRVAGTFIGSCIAYAYLTWFPFTITGMVISVLILDLLCMAIGLPDGSKMAAITLVVIMIVSIMSPDISPLLNGLLRFTEATVGALIGITLAWILQRIPAKKGS